MKRGLILVEGQTEERFVKDVLAEALRERGLDLRPTLLVTKHVKDGPNFKGGVTNFARFEGDLRRLLHGSGGAFVTTLLDYYGLPDDFPGMADRPPGSPEKRVRHVEQAIQAHFGVPHRFLPFLALHEFEAWLFCAPKVLAEVLTEPALESAFAAVRNGFATPEDINDGATTAPSKRILQLAPKFKKPLHGPNALSHIGLDLLRAECPHFAGWVGKLEAFAAS